MTAHSDPPPGGPSGTALALLTAVVVAVLAAPVGIAAVHAARGGSDGSPPASGATSRRTPPASTGPSTAASPTDPPTPSATGPSASGPSPSRSPRPAARCWDGSSAPRVRACSEPRGARGLAWVFPSLAGQRCGRATDAGPSGVVLRRVCHARVGGDRAVVVYLQWSSPDAAVAYVVGQGLTRSGGSAGLERFAGETRRGTQVAQVYSDEPFGYLVTLPPGADPVAVTGQVASARPPGQVRGTTG